MLVNITRASNVACWIVSPSHSRQEEIWFLAAGYPAPGSGVPTGPRKDSNEAGSLQPLLQPSDAPSLELPGNRRWVQMPAHGRELPKRIGDRRVRTSRNLICKASHKPSSATATDFLHSCAVEEGVLDGPHYFRVLARSRMRRGVVWNPPPDTPGAFAPREPKSGGQPTPGNQRRGVLGVLVSYLVTN